MTNVEWKPVALLFCAWGFIIPSSLGFSHYSFFTIYFLKQMKVLVTGGAGFIGSHIVEHFQGNTEVRVLDNLRSGFMRNLAGFKHEFIEASILDRSAVCKAVHGVDYI